MKNGVRIKTAENFVYLGQQKIVSVSLTLCIYNNRQQCISIISIIIVIILDCVVAFILCVGLQINTDRL